MDSGLLETATFTSSKIDDDSDDMEAELSGLTGVREVNVDPGNHAVSVRYDPTMVDGNRIRGVIEGLGYSTTNESDVMTDQGDPAINDADAPLT